MAVTAEEVRAELEREEPNYARAAGLGPEALPHLTELAREDDVMLASKAVYLAGLIRHDDSAGVIAQAASSDDPRLRVAAAAAARNVAADHASEVLEPLVADDDIGVRKVALKSVPSEASDKLRAAVKQAAEDPSADEHTKRLSRDTLRRLGG